MDFKTAELDETELQKTGSESSVEDCLEGNSGKDFRVVSKAVMSIPMKAVA